MRASFRTLLFLFVTSGAALAFGAIVAHALKSADVCGPDCRLVISVVSMGVLLLAISAIPLGTLVRRQGLRRFACWWLAVITVLAAGVGLNMPKTALFIGFVGWMCVFLWRAERRQLQALGSTACPSCGVQFGAAVAIQAREAHFSSTREIQSMHPQLMIHFAPYWDVVCPNCLVSARYNPETEKLLPMER